jgi:hypothetical protein
MVYKLQSSLGLNQIKSLDGAQIKHPQDTVQSEKTFLIVFQHSYLTSAKLSTEEQRTFHG